MLLTFTSVHDSPMSAVTSWKTTPRRPRRPAAPWESACDCRCQRRVMMQSSSPHRLRGLAALDGAGAAVLAAVVATAATAAGDDSRCSREAGQDGEDEEEHGVDAGEHGHGRFAESEGVVVERKKAGRSEGCRCERLDD